MAHNNLMLVAQLSGLRIRFSPTVSAATAISRAASTANLHLSSLKWWKVSARSSPPSGALAAALGTSDVEDVFFDLQTAYCETGCSKPSRFWTRIWWTTSLMNFQLPHRTMVSPRQVPIVVAVPANKLRSLAEIITEIEDTSGVRFSVDQVYYSEPEAEAAGGRPRATGRIPSSQ
ncbi:hypothetical protein [Mesorhizobium sangaii]|uniref:Uncharacterized protein n=1 Tax=Mesorhizobium sangaii TaxID=505389 RepID=A0A841PU34_9HYPH|nr:hypothetical protein [Mesorhizobium sangaii]MBB6414060.1 hypothetical protein [Mesorhizobium sangaii]